MMQPLIREALGLPEFDVRGLYRAVEILGRNKEPIITAFRKRFLAEYGPEVTDTVFDWTSLVYFGDKPENAMRGHSKDGHPEECQVMVGVAQLAKPLGVPIGLTVMPGNTHDGKHMLETFGQVREDLTDGSTMIFDAGANNKTVLDEIVEDSKHYRPGSASTRATTRSWPGSRRRHGGASTRRRASTASSGSSHRG